MCYNELEKTILEVEKWLNVQDQAATANVKINKLKLTDGFTAAKVVMTIAQMKSVLVIKKMVVVKIKGMDTNAAKDTDMITTKDTIAVAKINKFYKKLYQCNIDTASFLL